MGHEQKSAKTFDSYLEVNTLGIFACNFSTFFKVFKGSHFGKLPTESERSDRF